MGKGWRLKTILTDEECDAVIASLSGVWGQGWQFGSQFGEPEVQGFDKEKLLELLGDKWFVDNLKKRGVKHVFELERKMPSDLQPSIVGSPEDMRSLSVADDVVWTSAPFDWVVQIADHEVVNVGGWMLMALKSALPNWEEHQCW